MNKWLWRHFNNTIKSERGEFGKSKEQEEAEQGIAQAGSQMYQRGAMTPEELQQYKASFGTGKDILQMLMGQLGLGPKYGKTGEEQYQQQGQLAQTLYNQILQQTVNPDAYYMSTLNEQLQQAQDYINRNAQQRGLLRSGIPIENMGRAGVELAIQEANARMNARQQALSNAQSLQQNIGSREQTNIANLMNLYGGQQQYGLQSAQRQAGQAQQAAQYQAYPSQAKLANYYSGQAAQQALPGQLIGAAGTALGGWLGGL